MTALVEILRRRPDARGAERQVAAQSAQIGVAEADLHPTIFINGTLGWDAENLSQTGSSTWTVSLALIGIHQARMHMAFRRLRPFLSCCASLRISRNPKKPVMSGYLEHERPVPRVRQDPVATRSSDRRSGSS
jgi:hypothetical protein